MKGADKARCAAFTLIEVTLGMAILILIFGVIFQLVQYSVLGAEAAGKYSLRNREVSGLFALVRQLCLDLPLKSQLGLVPRQGGGYDLSLTNAPLAILPDRYEGSRVVELQLVKSASGDGRILRLVEIFTPTNSGGRFGAVAGETNSFELMRDIRRCTWSVWNPQSQKLETEWAQPIKPAYLQLELVRRDGARDLTNSGIFWIPTGYGPSGQPPTDPLTLTGIAAPTNSAPTNGAPTNSPTQ